MIIWLNGTFGVGKSTTSAELLSTVANTRIFDPEMVGYLLRDHLADIPTTDFQHWPAWRPLVVATAAELAAQSGEHLLAPQSVLYQRYWEEIHAGLTACGLHVFHVLLDAEESVLRQRINGSDKVSDWRFTHLANYREALPWMRAAADLVVDTTSLSPSDVARGIAEALPALDR